MNNFSSGSGLNNINMNNMNQNIINNLNMNFPNNNLNINNNNFNQNSMNNFNNIGFGFQGLNMFNNFGNRNTKFIDEDEEWMKGFEMVNNEEVTNSINYNVTFKTTRDKLKIF
jgi:hypothetical protein